MIVKELCALKAGHPAQRPGLDGLDRSEVEVGVVELWVRSAPHKKKPTAFAAACGSAEM